MLTVQTQIPTIARGQIRSLCKNHPAWNAFLTETGMISANARNADLITFALRHPDLTAQIETILALSPDAVQDDVETMINNMIEAPAPEGAYSVDALLGSVDQFLSPLVRDTLSNALRPVVDAANKPAVEIDRVVEVERIIEVAPGEAPRVVAPKARRDRTVTFRALFPSKAKDAWRDNSLTLWAGAAAPALDPFYVVDHEQMALFMSAMEAGVNTWFVGPAGTGKTSIPFYAGACLGRPVVRIGMTRQTEISDLVGGQALRNGVTVWEDGLLVKAMRQPGTIIVFDEATIAPAGVQAIIQQVADDHRHIELPTGEVVKAADGVVFVICDNTAGSGDEGGLYAGTNISNAALVTRFKWMVPVDYLPVAREAEALANHTACPLPAAKHLAELVARARKLPALAGVVISLRQMIGITQCVQKGFGVKTAFNVALLSRMPATERAAMEALLDLTFSSGFEALMAGQAIPAAPSNSAAAAAFPDQF